MLPLVPVTHRVCASWETLSFLSINCGPTCLCLQLMPLAGHTHQRTLGAGQLTHRLWTPWGWLSPPGPAEPGRTGPPPASPERMHPVLAPGALLLGTEGHSVGAVFRNDRQLGVRGTADSARQGRQHRGLGFLWAPRNPEEQKGLGAER